MAGKSRHRNAEAVSDIASALIDPVLRKRSGVSLGLVQSWEEIVGERYAGTSRPEKIQWPRRITDDDPFEPATLVIACEGFAAIALQHESGQIIERINAFLGFPAIARVKIVQKPVGNPEVRKPIPLRDLKPDEQSRLDDSLSGIEDEGLRQALENLGHGVIGSQKR